MSLVGLVLYDIYQTIDIPSLPNPLPLDSLLCYSWPPPLAQLQKSGRQSKMPA